jgi:hypothetical protein
MLSIVNRYPGSHFDPLAAETFFPLAGVPGEAIVYLAAPGLPLVPSAL